MDLILWRHAEAEPGGAGIPDDARKLTAKGVKQANKMAYWLDCNLPESCRVLVSPTLRTRETVEALKRKCKVLHELAPDATAEAVLAAANWPNSREPVLIVGHQPYLGQIAASLIMPHQEECAIRKGNVWWITQKLKDETGLQTYLKALMTPDLVIK
ncbi:MAG: histidine phosphatase family protein [Undibacterium sp.]|nr:histidine phosphatase family protein [Undibacterium sp.]MDO9192864.1 histidine phosphatase family protein [Undibacterium sp.]